MPLTGIGRLGVGAFELDAPAEVRSSIARVPQLSDAAKGPLLDEQLSLKNAQVSWGAIGVLGSPFTSHVLYLPTVVSGVMIAVLRRQENAVTRALADPPRSDYATQTRAHSRRYIPGRLGLDPLAEAADRVAVTNLRAAAYLEAAVRAEERAMGATADGAHDLARAREAEGRALLESARAQSVAVASESTRFAIAIASYATRLEGLDLADSPARPTRTLDVSDAVQAAGRITGLVVSDLDTELDLPEFAEPTSLRQGLSTVTLSVAELARTSRVLSHRLVVTGLAPLPIGELERIIVPLEPDDLLQTREYGFGLIERQRGNEPQAIGWFRRASELGDAHAAYELGAYEVETGNEAAATRWFNNAASAGLARALRALGDLAIRRGDDDVAAAAFERASSAGDVDAMVSLSALMVRRGDLTRARSLVEQAEQTERLHLRRVHYLTAPELPAGARDYFKALEAGTAKPREIGPGSED